MTNAQDKKSKPDKKTIIITVAILILTALLVIIHKKGYFIESAVNEAKNNKKQASNTSLPVATETDSQKLKAIANKTSNSKNLTLPFSNLIQVPPVNDIKPDKSGRIWIATENGVYKYENSEITNYTIENGKYPFRQANCIEIENNNVLVGSLYGLSSLSQNSKFVNITPNYELPSEIIWKIQWDGNNLWFSTQNGIAFKSEKKPTICLNTSNTNNGLRNNWCMQSLRFSNWLAVAHDNGLSLWFLNLQAANPTSWRNLDKTKSAISIPIRDMVFDGQKLWIATPSGLMLINTPAEKLYSNFSSELISFTELHGLPSNSINTMVFHKNSIWLGTSKGLARIKIHNNQIQTIVPITGEPNEAIRKLSLHDDILWIGTNKGVQFINTAMVD